jgi:hypothetical protein
MATAWSFPKGNRCIISKLLKNFIANLLNNKEMPGPGQYIGGPGRH